MEAKVSGPGVQHTADAEASAESLGIVAEVEQGPGCCGEEQAEEGCTIVTSQRAQLGRQGEDDVEVVHGQDALDALLDPAGLSEALARGAVPIVTG